MFLLICEGEGKGRAIINTDTINTVTLSEGYCGNNAFIQIIVCCNNRKIMFGKYYSTEEAEKVLDSFHGALSIGVDTWTYPAGKKEPQETITESRTHDAEQDNNRH